MIDRLICWLFRQRRTTTAPQPCPDFIPDLPPFVVHAQRSRLDFEWTMDDYEQAVDEWSTYIDQPHVIQNARGFLETQWKK